jgi:hypothetical protein
MSCSNLPGGYDMPLKGRTLFDGPTAHTKRILMIDDTRDELDVSCRLDLIARNFWAGRDALKLMGPWDLLYLDHDLNSFSNDAPNGSSEWTGYDIMRFLEENPQFLPGNIRCISSNPPGRQRIEMVIKKLYEGKSNV